MSDHNADLDLDALRRAIREERLRREHLPYYDKDAPGRDANDNAEALALWAVVALARRPVTASGDAEKLIAEWRAAARMREENAQSIRDRGGDGMRFASEHEAMATAFTRCADALEAALRAAAPAPATNGECPNPDHNDALCTPACRALREPAPASAKRCPYHNADHDPTLCERRWGAPAPVTGLTDETAIPDAVRETLLREIEQCGWIAGVNEGRNPDSFAMFTKRAATIQAFLAASDATGGKAHDACEHSRDCIACGKRIAPANGLCFSCATTDPKVLAEGGKAREIPDRETVAKALAQHDGFEYDYKIDPRCREIYGNAADVVLALLQPEAMKPLGTHLLESKDGTSITSAPGEVFGMTCDGTEKSCIASGCGQHVPGARR